MTSTSQGRQIQMIDRAAERLVLLAVVIQWRAPPAEGQAEQARAVPEIARPGAPTNVSNIGDPANDCSGCEDNTINQCCGAEACPGYQPWTAGGRGAAGGASGGTGLASDSVATPAPVTSMGGPDGDEEGSSRRREGEMLLLIFFLTIICGMCVFCMVLLLVKWQ